jgi:hypothetical protein
MADPDLVGIVEASCRKGSERSVTPGIVVENGTTAPG